MPRQLQKRELQKSDLEFISWTPAKMKKLAKLTYEEKKKSYAKVKAIKKEKRTFENTILILDEPFGAYDTVFSHISILSEVSPKKEVRDGAHELLTEYGERFVDLDYDITLYQAFLEYYEGVYQKEKKKLRVSDNKLVEESLRDYKRAGFDKDAKVREKVKTLMKKMTKLSQSFSKELNDYEDFILCTEKELDGLDQAYIRTLPVDRKTGKYMVTLAYPHIMPFMAKAANRKKRKELAEKNLQKGGKKNVRTLKELVTCRHNLAKLLGYAHHGDFRTETRMAKNAKVVEKFSQSLLKQLAPLAKKEIKALTTFAHTLGIPNVEHYDLPYVQTLYKKSLFDTDAEMLRPYFPLPHVLPQLFSLLTTLYGVTITTKQQKLWHKDVLFYEVRNESDKSLVGYFALDLFPREGKFGHAACMGISESHELAYKSSSYKAPFAALVCNFRAPVGKGNRATPSLLTLGEVETLFHEFGHLFHHLLSLTPLPSYAGTNVVWDFVEAPSQYMENFLWNKESLRTFSSHHVTKESLSDELIDKVLKGKNFMNASGYVRQLIFGIVDMHMHTKDSYNATKEYIAMNEKYLSLSLPKATTLFPASFGHMVGYDAGYYSYLWALVYACDIYSEFEKAMAKDMKKDGKRYGKEVKKVGTRFRKEILEQGGSIDELTLVKNFLRREPNNEAFLREVTAV